MEDLKYSVVLQYIKEAIETIPFEYNLTPAMLVIVSIVLMFQLGKIAIDTFLHGSAFEFSKLVKPGFTVLIVSGWSLLFQFTTNTLPLVLGQYVHENQKSLAIVNENIYSEMLVKRREMKDKLNNLKEVKFENNAWYDNLGSSISSLSENTTIAVLDASYKFMLGFDYMMYICFSIVASIWLVVIGLGGPIALIISLLSGGFTALKTWAKNYAATFLWLPVAGIILSIVNTIGTKIITGFIQDTIEMNYYSQLSGYGYEEFLSASISIMIIMVLVSLLLIIAKLILLSKVPNMINTWIPGGGAAGGGLAAAYVPISIAKNVASSGAAAAGKVSKGLNAN